jgi:hypothetical protein
MYCLHLQDGSVGSGRCQSGGQDSIVSVAACHRLDSSEMESQWGQDFLRPSRPAPRPTQPPVKWVLRISRGVKQAEYIADHPLPSSAGLQMGCSYTSASHLCLHRHVMGWSLPRCQRGHSSIHIRTQHTSVKPQTLVILTFLFRCKIFINTFIINAAGIFSSYM